MANEYLTGNSNVQLGEYLDRYVPLVVPDSQDLTAGSSFNAGNVQAILYKARIYRRMTTSMVADGVRVIEASGVKFVEQNNLTPKSFVEIRNDPPPTPNIGDVYIAGKAPSGAWATFADYICLYAGHDEWDRMRPVFGDAMYSEADGQQWHYDMDGNWVQGVVADNIQQKSLGVPVIKDPPQTIIRDIRNTPPPGAGTQNGNGDWIIGLSPSGWPAGEVGTPVANAIANRTGTVYRYTIPIKGMRVTDTSRTPGVSIIREFDGTQWIQVAEDQPELAFIPIVINPARFSWDQANPENQVSSPNGAQSPVLYSAILDPAVTHIEVDLLTDINFNGVLTYSGPGLPYGEFEYRCALIIDIDGGPSPDFVAVWNEVDAEGRNTFTNTYQEGGTYKQGLGLDLIKQFHFGAIAITGVLGLNQEPIPPNFDADGNRVPNLPVPTITIPDLAQDRNADNVLTGTRSNKIVYEVANASPTARRLNIRMGLEVLSFEHEPLAEGLDVNTSIKFTNITQATGELTVRYLRRTAE